MQLANVLVFFSLSALPAMTASVLCAQKSTEVRGSVIAKALAGSWRLVSVETIRPNGEIIHPFYGKHPKGLLIYDRSGWMSVQMISDPAPTVPKESSREKFSQATPAEKAAAIDGFYAYYGTWTVDDAGTTVTHHIKQSLYPGERDTEAVRRLSLQGKPVDVGSHGS